MNEDYLTGLIDGKGHFGIHKLTNSYTFTFTITKRIYDLEFLTKIKDMLEIGRVYEYRHKNYSLTNYIVNHRDDIKKLLEILDKCDFLSIKKEQYKIWKKAFIFYNENSSGAGRGNKISETVNEKMKQYCEDLKNTYNKNKMVIRNEKKKEEKYEN